MNFQGDWNTRRSPFAPMQYPIGNFYTDAQKTEMKDTFGENLFHNLHLIPEPLKKNLADTLPTNQKESIFEGSQQRPSMGAEYSRLSGIASFFTGMMSALSGAVFRRARSPEAGDVAWQHANGDYKNVLDPASEANVAMSECKTAAVACEDKLNKVRQLLTNKTTNRYISRRPRRVFVDPTSVEEQFEDAFAPEDFIGVANDTIIEYFSPLQYQEQEYYEVDAPIIRLQTAPASEQVPPTAPKIVTEQEQPATKENNPAQVVSSCEDKLSKLKALLQNKRNARTKELVPETPVEVLPTRPTKSIPIVKPKDKKYKNPHRLYADKRQKTRIKQDIQEDMLFAEEVNLDESSVDNSPSFHSLEKTSEPSFDTPQEYFDEITGRFRSTSASSDDSYQIVFTDIPQRVRSTSECDSEDSFIVFEDSPDSCYTSNDVFGDSSDSSDSESDSGCDNMRMPQCLSRTVSNLADASLYDEVDGSQIVSEVSEINTGLLLDERRKALKKNLPAKKVRFSEAAPRVHVMRVWAFAARQARPGHWERYARDRERFQRRIADVDMAVSWVLKPQHRARVMFQRFMPWWNAQKRKELAEKKELEEQMKKEALEKELAGADNDTDTRPNNHVKTDPTEVNEVNKSEDVINEVKNCGEIVNKVINSEEVLNSECTEIPSDNTQKGLDDFRSDVEKIVVEKCNVCMVISNYNSGVKCEETNYEILDKVRSDADIIRNDLDVKYESPKTIEFVASI
ncbi:uncharacterized protein LOC115456233 [Manduca sexta]|uniref:uncharacterized protein LOC115456233 n=1 Tax=Manduca sexta TaxID=7130 RepID=UPI00188F20DA|nr:uncharacterized protein LOC115456233 [Manduca sexta]